jgi:hypothetical protein
LAKVSRHHPMYETYWAIFVDTLAAFGDTVEAPEGRFQIRKCPYSKEETPDYGNGHGDLTSFKAFLGAGL